MPRVCITVHGKNAQPYRFSLEREVVRLGRASDNDIVIDCPSVSSHHCEMRRNEGGYTLEDKDSTNGIKLDGDRMDIIDLENGQDVLVGDAALDFKLTNQETDTLAKEDHVPQQRAPLPKLKKNKSSIKNSRDEDNHDKPVSKRPTPALSSRPPQMPVSPLVSSQSNESATNFAITIGLLFLAITAFYFGLASGHRSKFPKTEYPQSKGLWGDMWNKENPLIEKKKGTE
jgi:pSer/pThr/pTyr-binding forkhead associated (FHA) protein